MSLKLEIKIQRRTADDSRGYPNYTTLGELDVELRDELAWGLYRHCVMAASEALAPEQDAPEPETEDQLTTHPGWEELID